MLCASALFSAFATGQSFSLKTEPVIGGPSEGCEHVFVGLPAKLTSTARIADANEPGQPLVLSGIVRTRAGKPAAYPSRSEPEHIHMHVIERGKGTYYIEDVWFDDDPLVKSHRSTPRPRGGHGLTTPQKKRGRRLESPSRHCARRKYSGVLRQSRPSRFPNS